MQFMRETTGAVFDTLAQIHLIRGNARGSQPLPAALARSLRRVRSQTSRWYQWSVRVLEARSRSGVAMPRSALEIADEIAGPRTCRPATRRRRI